jgi:hypothetical protein
VSVVVPTTAPTVAVIFVVPAFRVVARPPAAMVATPVFDEAHVAVAVRSWVELLLYVPIALNCCVWLADTDGAMGVTEIEVRVGAEAEFPLLHPASSPANTRARTNRRFFMGETPLATYRFLS